MKITAEMFRETRQARGMTLSQVADEIGVDRSTVHRWDKGERTPRGIHARLHRAWVLGLPPFERYAKDG